tara:strand:- start:2121 stop:4985 length:2865 start_codon:yes stop_codon:yes gene_type:complete
VDNSTFESIRGLVNGAVIFHHSLMEKSSALLSYEKIIEITDAILTQHKSLLPNIADTDRQRLLKSVTDNYSATIGEKIISVTNSDAPRWLDAKKHEISWNHWNAYKNMLINQGRSQTVIDTNEEVIDTILDYSGDPRQPGTWARKGLVMGNVQSGKTQNYLGLINKAIDAGYQTIIVLGGHLNDLRMQTQERIDEGVLGVPSRHLIDTNMGQLGPIGVGRWHKNNVIPATTTSGDFSGPFADKFGVKLDGSDPVIFTIKKHTGVMSALAKWIKEQHYLEPSDGKILNKPMLLIDDEADYASINTKAQKEEVTLTNNLIRELLSLFGKSTYVAYTATPFANIFIDPDKKSYSEHDDLFPSDFMVKMSVPSNYMGQEFFFGEKTLRNEINATSPIIAIDDHEHIYELKPKDPACYELPESLKDAIRAFVIVTAVRAIKGESNSHNTMLVNVSHLAKHQNELESLIDAYKKNLFQALSTYGSMGVYEASRNEYLLDLEKTYNNKFLLTESYELILKRLSGNERRDISVWAINQSAKKKDRHELNYATYKEFGLNVIVIGGHKLSRGLTLEGLSISYFARNSKAYDTLMQMCRWFGYRQSYRDLCKVYLPEESIKWYAFISSTIRELYNELELMADRGERPKDFGLRVREHPGSMLITAKNKVGWGQSKTISQDLWGQTQRRFKFHEDEKINLNNVEYTKLFLDDLVCKSSTKVQRDKDENGSGSGSLLISNVSYKSVIDFIKAIALPEDDLGNSALVHQLSVMEKAELPLPKVLLFNQNASASPAWFQELSSVDKEFLETPYLVAGAEINLPRRAMSLDNKIYRVRSVSLGNSDDERLFLSPEQQAIIKKDRKDKKKRKAVDHDYIATEYRDFPGLKIYFFGVSQKRKSHDTDPQKLIHGHEATLGFTLSFPRSEELKGKTAQEIKNLIEKTRHSYYLNKIHAKNKDLSAYEDIDVE